MTKAIKIGRSRNPKDRLASLQTANPRKLTLLAIRPSSDAAVEESRLHEQFSEHRIEGEWFEPWIGLETVINVWALHGDIDEILKLSLEDYWFHLGQARVLRDQTPSHSELMCMVAKLKRKLADKVANAQANC